LLVALVANLVGAHVAAAAASGLETDKIPVIFDASITHRYDINTISIRILYLASSCRALQSSVFAAEHLDEGPPRSHLSATDALLPPLPGGGMPGQIFPSVQ